MKKIIILLTITLASIGNIAAQSPVSKKSLEKFKQEQKASLDNFKQDKQKELAAYRDSLNREFANYLKETWKSFNLERQERGFKPMPQPPVYKPIPDKIPVHVPVIPVPEPAPSPFINPPPIPEPQPRHEPVRDMFDADFFGGDIRLQKLNFSINRLSSVSEDAVANFWLSLSKMPIEQILNDVTRLQTDLRLNDWGVFQLVNKMFYAYFPNGNENEQTVFSIFMLNQLGYKARIGRAENVLLPLIAIQNNVLNTSYFIMNTNNQKVIYYTINQNRKPLSSVQTCGQEYGNAGKIMNLTIAQYPILSNKTSTQNLTANNQKYNFNYNSSLPVFYETYPCVDFSIYADAPLNETFLKSLRDVFQPILQNKSQEEQVNYLLHFVHSVYYSKYKTDQDNYGYEKWNFAEETLIADYTDCDDNAIFFAQLVKNLLGMKVVIIYYPGIHLSTAVKFDNPNTQGDYVLVDNAKYLICDPTYFGSNIGMAMPDLRNNEVQIFK